MEDVLTVKISIVVPFYNERDNVRELHREIVDVCEKEGYIYEVIFIDDGSSDDTYELMKTLNPLKIIKLRKNYGQTSATDVGIKAAQYDYIVTMDGDRQNDPADIPMMIRYMEENSLDVVSGWRKNRKDTPGKKFTSRGANFLRGIIVKDNIHDSGCALKVYHRKCFENVNLYGEMHRFIPAILMIKGYRIGEVEVHHRPRVAGKTKYSWQRAVKGFLDMISVWFWNKYAVRPLHLLGTLGLFFLAVGGIFGIWSIVLSIMGANMSNYTQPLLTVFLVVIGLLLFVFGLMADMLTKIYFGSNIGAPYSVEEVIDNQFEKINERYDQKAI